MKLALNNTNELLPEETQAEVVDTRGEVEEQGVAASLGLNGQLFVMQLINFAIVVVILWFLILKPLVKMLEERKKLIDESIENAKKVENEVKESNKRFQEKIDEATVGANQIVSKAKEDAEKVVADVKEESKKELEEMVGKAKKKIEEDRLQMLDEVKADVVDMVVDSVQKVLGGAVDEKIDQAWVKQRLAKKK